MFQRLKNFLLIVLMAGFVTACAESQAVRVADTRINQSVSTVNASLSRLGGPTSVRGGGAQFRDDVFVAAKPVKRSTAVNLPARLEGANAVRLESRDPLSLSQVAARLSESTGVAHVLQLGPNGQTQSEARIGDAPREGEASIRPNLRGPLSKVLDRVADNFDVVWSYENGRVSFRDYVTMQYQMAALPVQTTANAGVGAEGMSASRTFSADIWAEIEAAVQNLLSEGSTVSIGRSTGTLTINARKADHKKVDRYIANMNRNIGQQVAFDVNVITVTLNENVGAGIDLNAIFTRGNDSFSLRGAGGGDGIGSVNIGIVDNDLSVNAVASALARYGQVSVSQRAGTTTANNQVAPIEVTESRGYVRQISLESNGDGNDRITRETDTVTTGFQMQLLPRIMNNRDIMVQFSVALSELNDLEQFGAGTDAVVLPNTSNTRFEQQAVVQNGQTLIMAGFERRRVERSGSRGGENLALGASMDVGASRVATVLMITPRIVAR